MTNTAVRLREGVTPVQRARGETLLVSPDGRSALRTGRVGGALLPLLLHGTTREQLMMVLRQRYPGAGDVDQKVQRFLETLRRAGMLTGASPRRMHRVATERFAPIDVNPVARRVARVLNGRPGLVLSVLAVGIFSAVVGVSMAWTIDRHQLNPVGLVYRFDPIGLALFVCIVVPLHELAHAVACSAAGVPVTSAGIVWRGGIVPSPYVDTSQAYRVAGRWTRFLIPAGGPLVDVLASGAGAWGVVWTGATGRVGHAALYLLLISLVFLCFDTTPLTPSDGSHMLEAMLDDELARVAALSRWKPRLSPPRIVWTYRAACVAHTLSAAAVLIATVRP